MDREELVELIIGRLDQEADAIREAWNTLVGTATRHCAIDNLMPEAVAAEIYNAFPRNGEGFFSRATFREHKRTSPKFDELPPILGNMTFAIQDPRVVAKVGELTGMDLLEPDASLYAGGLSMMFKDDFLNPHIDHSHEASRQKYRRINLLYYVTPDWKQENGGNLELWNDDVTTPRTIVAKFNRLALMETSWHSVSPVLVETPRCCVSNYYFSEESPDKTTYSHVTSFTGRPEQAGRRAISKIDNGLRNFASSVLGMRRYKDQVYDGDANEAPSRESIYG